MAHLLIRNQILDDHRVHIGGDDVLVGRDREAGLRLTDEGVSRFHARLQRCGDTVTLVDLDSSNGTWVNGTRILRPTRLQTGDELRFGPVRVVFQAGEEKSDSRPAQRRGRRLPWGLVAGLIGLAVTSACAVAIVLLLEGPEPDSPGRPDEVGQAAGTHAPRTGPASPEVQPLPTDQRPTGGASAQGMPAEATPAPPAAPTERDAGPQPQTIVLRDGRHLSGVPLEAEDLLHLHLKALSGETLRIPREEIASLDGASYEPDLAALYAARLGLAGTTGELLEVAAWCGRQGLETERHEVARMVVEGDRENDAALAILGRHRYQGSLRDRAELESLGCLFADDRLVGSLQDARELRTLFLAAVGRTPLDEELASALKVSREDVVEGLLASEEHWRSWLNELLIRFLGPEGGAAMASQASETAGALAKGTRDFREVFLDLAASDAVRLRYPTPRVFVTRVLEVFIGRRALEDESLVVAATGMVGGERVAVFGERGSSREEFLNIVSRQPAFYRNQFRQESLRLVGREPERSALLRGAMKLAGAPTEFAALKRTWLVADEGTLRPAVRREMDAGRYARSIHVDAYGRLPTTHEEATLRSLFLALPEPGAVRGVLPGLLAGVPALAPGEAAAREWIATRFRRLLARAPRPDELLAFEKVLAEPNGRRTALAALLASQEYRTW